MARLAYVVGISEYTKWPALVNPVNDAKTMNEVLEKAEFNVQIFKNLDYVALSSCIAQFKYELREYDTGLFYYAGHGIEIDGDNYLIPSNADMETDEKIATSSVNLSSLTKDISKSEDGAFIIILDACRTRIAMNGVRGIKETGLSSLTNSPTGTFISFATGPDSKASDGKDSNGLYTKILSKYILEKGLKIEELFKKVRKKVAEESHRKQVPWDHSSLMGDFYFIESRSIAANIEGEFKSLIDYFEGQLETEFISYEEEVTIEEEEEDAIADISVSYENIVAEFNRRIETLEYEEFYIVSKTKTLAYRRNTIQWWNVKGDGYTDDLSEAGMFSKEYIKERIKPYNHHTIYTKSFALPVKIVKELFGQSIIPYNDTFVEKFYSVEEYIIGDLNWDLPKIMY